MYICIWCTQLSCYVHLHPAICQKTYMTHLCLLRLSRQAPPTMPPVSSTPRAPATTPPRNRPTPVELLESLLMGPGLTLSASTAGCVRARDNAQMETTVCVYIEVAIMVMWKCTIASVSFQLSSLTIPGIHIICRSKVVEFFSIILYTICIQILRDINYANFVSEFRFKKFLHFQNWCAEHAPQWDCILRQPSYEGVSWI